MNGMLLISYPCYESYILSNYYKRFWTKNYTSSHDCKKECNELKRFNISKINENTMLVAVANMHRSFLNYQIKKYDPSNIKNINDIIFNEEETYFYNNKVINALSLISMIFIDLKVIEEI